MIPSVAIVRVILQQVEVRISGGEMNMTIWFLQ
jgi:hypothetical protein